MGKITKKIFTAYDSLEFLIIAIFATVLFGSFVYYAWAGIKESGNTLALVSFSLLVVASAAGIARDIYKKMFSGISITIISLWVLCALFVVYEFYFA